MFALLGPSACASLSNLSESFIHVEYGATLDGSLDQQVCLSHWLVLRASGISLCDPAMSCRPQVRSSASARPLVSQSQVAASAPAPLPSTATVPRRPYFLPATSKMRRAELEVLALEWGLDPSGRTVDQIRSALYTMDRHLYDTGEMLSVGPEDQHQWLPAVADEVRLPSGLPKIQAPAPGAAMSMRHASPRPRVCRGRASPIFARQPLQQLPAQDDELGHAATLRKLPVFGNSEQRDESPEFWSPRSRDPSPAAPAGFGHRIQIAAPTTKGDLNEWVKINDI